MQEEVESLYMPSGMQQLVLDKPLHCNARDVSVCVLSSARVRCQYGLVPDAFILDFEPVTVDFTPNHDTNCGRLSLTFSTISFQDSYSKKDSKSNFGISFIIYV